MATTDKTTRTIEQARRLIGIAVALRQRLDAEEQSAAKYAGKYPTPEIARERYLARYVRQIAIDATGALSDEACSQIRECQGHCADNGDCLAWDRCECRCGPCKEAKAEQAR